MQTTEEIAQSRRLLRCLLFDILLVIVLLIPIAICEFSIEPVRRGFFCDDETIAYPFKPNTVTPLALGLLVALTPIACFVAVEFVRFYRAEVRIMQPLVLSRWQAPNWVLLCGKQLGYYAIGLLLTFDATELGKYTIGRLRPHFMAVCQPQLADGTTCDEAANHGRYIEDYICTVGDFTAADLRQARLSFPSGHSSLIFYTMVYLALYLQRQLTWRGSHLLRHFAQFALVMVAWFTALSRVMDAWHHWSDVAVGSLLGIAGALLTAVYIAKMFEPPKMRNAASLSSSSSARRIKLQFPTQLQQVQQHEISLRDQFGATTPPPYSLTSLHQMDSLRSFSNEQYCTKV